MASETLKDTVNDLKASLSKDGGVFERPGTTGSLSSASMGSNFRINYLLNRFYNSDYTL